jgi:hypothetical protein
MNYINHPYYVSENPILPALGQHLDHKAHAAMSISHGVFVPGWLGTFPKEYTRTFARTSGAVCPMLRPLRTLSSSGRRCTRGYWIPALRKR